MILQAHRDDSMLVLTTTSGKLRINPTYLRLDPSARGLYALQVLDPDKGTKRGTYARNVDTETAATLAACGVSYLVPKAASPWRQVTVTVECCGEEVPVKAIEREGYTVRPVVKSDRYGSYRLGFDVFLGGQFCRNFRHKADAIANVETQLSVA